MGSQAQKGMHWRAPFWRGQMLLFQVLEVVSSIQCFKLWCLHLAFLWSVWGPSFASHKDPSLEPQHHIITFAGLAAIFTPCHSLNVLNVSWFCLLPCVSTTILVQDLISSHLYYWYSFTMSFPTSCFILFNLICTGARIIFPKCKFDFVALLFPCLKSSSSSPLLSW